LLPATVFDLYCKIADWSQLLLFFHYLHLRFMLLLK